MRTLLKCIGLFCLLASASCLAGDDSALDIGSVNHPRYDELRARLSITLQAPPNGGLSPACSADIDLDGACCSESFCSARGLASFLEFGCQAAAVPVVRSSSGDCAASIRLIEREVCVAQRLLEIVESPGNDPIAAQPSLDLPQFTELVVGPQDAESNSELSLEALRRLSIAQGTAGNALAWTTSTSPPPVCSQADLNALAFTGPYATGAFSTVTQVEELARFYREIVILTEDATEHVIASGATVSDSHFSTQADRAEVAALRNAPFASRVASAHALVGGDHELPALGATADSGGLFSRPPLSRNGQQALDMVRAAAMHPAFIDPTTSIDAFLIGGGFLMAPDDSSCLGYRLGRIYDNPALIEAAADDDGDELLRVLGLDRAAVAEARAWVDEEIRAFDRPRGSLIMSPGGWNRPARTLPPEALRDGTTSDFPLYSAVRLPPQPRLPAYWSSVVRYDTTLAPSGTTSLAPTWLSATPTSGGLPQGATWGVTDAGTVGRVVLTRNSGRTVASLREDAVLRARSLIRNVTNAGSSLALRNARDVLAQIVPEGLGGDGTGATDGSGDSDGSLLGRARLCTRAAQYRIEIDLAASGITSADGIEVVLGSEGLDCSVLGTIDGVECSATDLSTLMPTQTTPFSPSGGVPFPSRFGVTLPMPLAQNGPIAGTYLAYVVRRAPLLDADRAPGQYEPLIGFTFQSVPTGNSRCMGAPISPDLEARVAELVGATPSDPARSEINCTGLPEDLQLPLENELLGDSFPEESSWRTFLATAESSAAEADALGEEVIRVGLEMDLRAEREADELERLCGVRLNLSSLFDSFPAATVNATGGTCSQPYYTYIPEGNLCALDPIRFVEVRELASAEDLARLRECIGSQATVPYAALGDQPVCLWQYGDDPSTVCRDATSELPCPTIRRGAVSASECDVPAGATARLVTDSELLRLFVQPYPGDQGGGSDTESFPCETLAAIRAHLYQSLSEAEREAAIEEVATSGLFDATTFRPLAQRLGWVPMAGNYSRVTFSRSTIASTGWPGATSPELWPSTQVLSSVGIASLCPADLEGGLGTPGGDPLGESRGLFCTANVPVTGSTLPRARANDMLARAVIAARVMAGVTLADEISMPYFPRGGTARVRVTSGTAVNPVYLRANEAELFLDQSDDEPSGSWTDTASFGGSAEWTLFGSTDVLWTNAPYDQSTFVDTIVRGEGNAGLIVRRIGSEVDVGTEALSNSSIFFSSFGLRNGYIEQALRRDIVAQTEAAPHATFSRYGSSVSIGDLTDYFVSGVRVGYDPGHGCFGGCTCQERPVACIGANPTLDVRSSVSGNLAFVGALGGLTDDDILNGLELVCAAGRIDAPDPDLGCDEPPEDVRSVRQMLQAEAFLRCKASRVEEAAAASVVRDLPAEAVEALRRTGPSAIGGDSGDIASATSDLGTALIALSNARYEMASSINAVADQVDQVRSLIATSAIAAEIEDLQLVSSVLNQVSQCASALGGTNIATPQSFAGAAVVCANSAAQVGLSVAISQLSDTAERMRLEGQLAGFDQQVAANMDRMREAATSVRTQLGAIDGALARLRTARSSARRALARALFLESDGTDTHFAASSVYRARYNTALARYTDARQRALRSAFIARRAVEQRLAMQLETITDDLPTVEAPYRWADELCAIPAIDYRVVRSPGDASSMLTGPEGYASAYIGDYVSRLRRTVESYNFAFPFRDGTDTVVISLRDDVFGSRAECEVDAPNLVPQSDFLDALPSDDAPGWEPRGCQPVLSEPGTDVDAHCASARPLTETENPPGAEPRGGGSDYGRPAGYELVFGGSPAATPASRLGQSLALDEGVYRVSWYGRDPESTMEVTYGEAKGAVAIFDETGAPLLDEDVRVAVLVSEEAPDGWTRYHNFFRVSGDQVIEVALIAGTSSLPEDGIRLQVAGVMIENVTGTVSGDLDRLVPNPFGSGTIAFNVLRAPGPYFGTGRTATRVMAACPDSDGTVFRSQSWSQGCTRVCPDGYDGECDDSIATARCYHQVSIPFDADVIEGLLTGTPTGFAAGNYNYRVEQLAVNVVGTGVRECDGGATCFGSGNLSYSLLHTGEFPVRNARGETYYAPLFPGRIESARALMAERYLTNPLSSADTSLIASYRRPDFSGRPIAGGLTLRIWDEPGLRFDAIEDVQIVLDYRYWTHQR